MAEERESPKLSEDLQTELKQKAEEKQQALAFRRELEGLLVEFKELLDISARVYQEEEDENYGNYYELGELNEEDKNKFFEWNKKFETLLAKAVDLNLIKQEFINKHKNYTADEWNEDEFWLKVKDHFQERDQYSEQIEFLNAERRQLSSSHNERVDDYKLAALITSWTIAIPLIIGAIYLIDRFLITLPTLKENKETADSLASNKTAAESELKKHGSDIQRDLYYQAAKVGTTKTFFEPLKEAAKEAEEAEKPKPPKPGNSSSSSSSSSSD